MTTAQEYRLLEANTPDGLTKLVNDLLNGEWKLYGSPAVSNSNLSVHYIQAIVREYEQPGAWG